MQYIHDLKPDEFLVIMADGKVAIASEASKLHGRLLACVVGQNISSEYFMSDISVRLVPSATVVHVALSPQD